MDKQISGIKNSVFITIALLFAINVQNIFGQRFLEDVFDGVDSVDNIIYGQAINYKGENQSLYFDFFSPKGDTSASRPLLLYAHGGGFAGGSPKYPSIRTMAVKLAKRGYAVASVNYRLDPNFDYGTSIGDKREMTDAMHDMRAAVRFFKANMKKYRIDTSNIFVGGESAGVVASMMVGYVDKKSELKAYPKTSPENVEGNSGTPGYSSKVKSVLCLCGAITDTSAIESPKDPPLLWVHGSGDPIISVTWAEEILQRADNVGLPYQKIIFEGATHCPWIKTLPNSELYLDSLVDYVSAYMNALVTGKNIFTSKRKSPRLKVANVLQSNMVVQQGAPFRVWGTSFAGDTIQVTADWLKNPVKVYAGKDGSWKGVIDIPRVHSGDFTPRTLTVFNSSDTVRLSNLLIGEVWLCAGQSNMEMTVGKVGWYSGILNYQEVVKRADYPHIRVYTEAADFKIIPQKDSRGKWVICSPETAGSFSAIAYSFGRRLFEELNIPIGLVVSAAAGANGSAFVPESVLQDDPLLKKKYWDPNQANMVDQNVVDTLGFFSKVRMPALIYNGMIHPLENLSIKGFLWYQGESNYNDGDIYTHLITRLTDTWRKRFGREDLPFYFVQIAPYTGNTNKCPYILGQFWEDQMNILKIKNTGMALSNDVGDLKNVHPQNKEPVGERLAGLALNRDYGFNDIHDEGPRVSRYKMKNNGRVIVYFAQSTVGSGLSTNDGKPPRNFLVAGKDRVFYSAAARIRGNKIKIKSDHVSKPVAIRYGFTNDAITNLENKEGLPAFPFRSDDWEVCPVSGYESINKN